MPAKVVAEWIGEAVEKSAGGKTKRQYPALKLNDTIFGVGDFVLLNQDDSFFSEPFIGRINELWEIRGSQQKRMRVQWMYRYKDVAAKVRPKNTTRNQLCWSDHIDPQEVSTLLDLVRIKFHCRGGEGVVESFVSTLYVDHLNLAPKDTTIPTEAEYEVSQYYQPIPVDKPKLAALPRDVYEYLRKTSGDLREYHSVEALSQVELSMREKKTLSIEKPVKPTTTSNNNNNTSIAASSSSSSSHQGKKKAPEIKDTLPKVADNNNKPKEEKTREEDVSKKKKARLEEDEDEFTFRATSTTTSNINSKPEVKTTPKKGNKVLETIVRNTVVKDSPFNKKIRDVEEENGGTKQQVGQMTEDSEEQEIDAELWSLLMLVRDIDTHSLETLSILEVIGFLKLMRWLSLHRPLDMITIGVPLSLTKIFKTFCSTQFYDQICPVLKIDKDQVEDALSLCIYPRHVAESFRQLENARPNAIFRKLGGPTAEGFEARHWCFPTDGDKNFPIFGNMLTGNGFRYLRVEFLEQVMMVPVQMKGTPVEAVTEGIGRLVTKGFGFRITELPNKRLEFKLVPALEETHQVVNVTNAKKRKLRFLVPAYSKCKVGFLRLLVEDLLTATGSHMLAVEELERLIDDSKTLHELKLKPTSEIKIVIKL